MLQNTAEDLSTQSLTGNLGYDGLVEALAIEFDFAAASDPLKPHVSVQFSSPLSSAHSNSLGFAWLPYALTKGGHHTVKVEFIRGIDEVSYLGDISFTGYNENTFLDFTGSTDWFDTYELGILKLYIDDMRRSLFEIPVNLGAIVAHDDLDAINPANGLADGTMACKSYVSLAGKTSETTDQSAAFQFLEWNYTSEEKCRIKTAECLKSMDITATKTLAKYNLRNIGKEKIYLKFIYKNVTDHSYILDQEGW